MSVVVTVWVSVGYLLSSGRVEDSVLSLGMLNHVVCLCRGCDGCCVFYLHCETWRCRCLCMGSVSVSSCRCCMFVSCVHPDAVLNAGFCMTCCLLRPILDARGDHNSRDGLMTTHRVVMSEGSHECLRLFTPLCCAEWFYYWLRFVCVCVYWNVVNVCALCESKPVITSKARPRTFVSIDMGSAVLFILSSRLLLYSAGSGMNRVQVVCLNLV